LRAAEFVAFCLLAMPLAGPGSRSVSKLGGKSLSRLPEESDGIWQAQRARGLTLYQSGQYAEAASVFDGLAAAARERSPKISARARSAEGAMQFAMHQYGAALQSFLSARGVAESIGDTSEIGMVDANLASLCTEMGDLENAARWIQGTLTQVTGDDREKHLAQIKIEYATIRARQKRMAEALELFREGIDAAASAGDWNLYAIGWNRIGEEYLKLGALKAAEGPLLEAYRVRKLRDLPLDTSYRNLGHLRLEQGDLKGASVLLDRAIALAGRPNGPIPAWYAYHYRGRLRLAQGRIREALGDFRVAVRLARAWRWSAPPDDDAMRRGAEGWLALVYSGLVEAGNRLYLETGDPALIRETLEAADEDRAGSPRALVEKRREDEASLPPTYWDALLKLQRAEVTALRSSTPAAREAVRNARAQIGRMEASAAREPPPDSGDLLRRARAEAGRDSAVISFQMGDRISWMWAVDGDGMAVYPLPPRGVLQTLIKAASEAIRDGDGAAAAAGTTAGAALYDALFGSLAPRFQRKARWLLALDDALFEVPFAALPAPPGDGSLKAQFLVERHAMEIIPSVAYWLMRSSRLAARAEAPLFLGVGDPIYNSADPRFSKPARGAARQASPLELFAAGRSSLPRLVASAAELAACARAWNGTPVLLEGAGASRSAIEEQLKRHPDVLHFATHFVPSGDEEPQATIALSLADGGVADVLQPGEIAGWHIGIHLVVLSGCHSAAGAVLPGTGLLGLNRAWLAAGAQSVISSHWAVPDESGSLFAVLYRNLSAHGLSAAQALRTAQLEMLRTGDWRSHPQYWGAYFAMGKE